MDRFESLRAFVAVADHAGFAAAARSLGLSPPAVTRSIASLEQHLGIALFRRSTRAVSLTEDGAAFLERSRRILADLREAEHLVMGGRATPQGQVYITAPVQFGRLHVLPVVASLLEMHPALTARVLLMDRNVRIIEEGIDVAVRIGVPADSALRCVGIGSVNRVVVASPGYLERAGVPTDAANLRDHATIANIGVREAGSWMVGGVRVTLTPRITVNTVDAAVAAAEAGLGIANLLSYQVSEAVQAGRLVRVLKEAEQEVPINLLFDQTRAAMPAVRAFVDGMRDHARATNWS